MEMRYLILVVSLLCLSCGPTPIFEQTYEIENSSWSYDDNKQFSFVSPDSTNKFDLILDVLHSEDYAYENLYIQLTTSFPNQEQVKDEISIPLIQDDGHWVGKGSSEKQVRVYLQQALRFKQIGEHTISLRQHSRDEELNGIKTVRLAIYPFIKEKN